MTTNHPNYQPVHLYPYSTELDEIHSNNHDYATLKRFHIIRHAEGTHNVNKEYKDIKNLDARLTELGKEQCKALADKLQQSNLVQETQLVVTSPLTRCMETAMLSFQFLTPHIPFVAHDSIRETVNYNCDRRRALSELEDHFHSTIHFGHVPHDHDALWEHYEQRLPNDFDNHRESAELHVVADRARDFWNWVQQRPEQEIVVCTHSAFLRAFKNWGQEGGVPLLLPQDLDERSPKPDQETPVVQYCGDKEFEAFLRSDYENCELRSFIGAFPK